MKTLRGSCLFAALALGTVAAATKTEVPPALTLTGDVKRVQLTDENGGLIGFEISLSLHFKNPTSTAILVYDSGRWPWLGGESFADSRVNTEHRIYVYSASGWPSSDRRGFLEIRRKLDHALPPADLIHTIQPGGSWDFERIVVGSIERKGSLDGSCKPWETIRRIDPLWLQVHYQMWPNSLEENPRSPKFGKRLRRKWKQSGELILDNLVSEPIAVTLPVKQGQP